MRLAALVLAGVVAGCIEPAPAQIFLEVQDGQNVANGAVWLRAADENATPVVIELPDGFPVALSWRGEERGEKLVTVEALDGNAEPIAWAARRVRFVRQFQDQEDAIVLTLVPWLDNCFSASDCSAPVCAYVVCEPVALHIGLCLASPNDSRCASDETCDVDVGCVTQ